MSKQKTLNPIANFIGKNPSEFKKTDIIKYIVNNDIQIVNFRYVANDGRLKTLNLPISSETYLNNILSYGERVDGSSLFPFIEAGSSDLYVVPRFSTAYLDPFAEIPTVGFICSYFNKDGNPLELSPEYTLRKADECFREVTGYSFQAMGELEFYVIGDEEDLFTTLDQKGYHESEPFTKFEQFRCEAMLLISKCGGDLKYGHSEVGNFTLNGKIYEQNEIEFQVNDVQTAADQLLIAKWILRTLAYNYGVDITFAPKITEGRAGSGMHFHTRIMNGEKSLMIEDDKLSSVAKRAIAGYIKCASSITAFGNTNPTSYFRLVPHQEAPTTVCWGDSNRSVLVRVPLGWRGNVNMSAKANPLEANEAYISPDKQTVEMRSPDGSSDIYLTLASLVVAARIGLEMDEKEALEIAEKSYVAVNIHSDEHKSKMDMLDQLPASCYESALELNKNRAMYEANNIFDKALIDGVISKLNSYNDKSIREEIKANPEIMANLVEEFYHCG